jgi:hypothetical protein
LRWSEFYFAEINIKREEKICLNEADLAFTQKIKQIDLKVKDLYWVIGRKSPASL